MGIANGIARFPMVGMGSMSDRVPFFGDSDPMGVTDFYKDAYRNADMILQGIVVIYNPQTHTAAVSVDSGQDIWTCVFADEQLSYAFGFSEAHPPLEGEYVLVKQIQQGMHAGVIVGRLAYPLCFDDGDKYGDLDQYHRRLYTQVRDTEDRNIPCMLKPFANDNDNSSHITSHFRPTDIYPGEFVKANQHNCGIKGGLFSATLLGGGANLRMSALSNTARLSCEHYKRYSLHGSTHEFHNGRYLSAERNFALYQEERLGGGCPVAKVWTYDSEAPVSGMHQTLRPRMKDLSGFFGHLSAKFCFRPDPDEPCTPPRVQKPGMPKEEGVSRETIDPSGQYRLSAAGMIAIERIGRIPVPVRNCYPTDKDHDIKPTPEILKPFEHKKDDPCYRQLELFDRQAYDLKNQYARVDGLGFTPDYDVPQEEDLKPIDDQYDKKFFGNETVKLKEYDKRRAGMYIGEDGSVIIRDAWGSEIVMLGGNISMACAGNVMILPGCTALTIAGDDIVQKAQNSIDIHASEHDVRLSAARNMEILGGGDEKQYSGGVIIESRGDSPRPWIGKDLGESANVSGITLKTKNQSVVIDGKVVNIRSKQDTRILSGDKQIDGNVSIAAKNTRIRSKNTIFSSGKSSIMSNTGGTYITGPTVGIGGSKGLVLTQGSKMRVPMQMVDSESVYDMVNPKCDEGTEDLSKEKEASAGFDRKTLDDMIFGFRKSNECRTDRSWVIEGPSVFRLYEPAWVQVINIYETLKKGGVKAVKYREDPEWDNGRPFPGKEAEDSAEYSQLEGLKPPKNLTNDGFNKSRKVVERETGVEDVKLKDNYLIRAIS